MVVVPFEAGSTATVAGITSLVLLFVPAFLFASIHRNARACLFVKSVGIGSLAGQALFRALAVTSGT